MSGGSWDYVWEKVQDAGDRLLLSRDKRRRALGAHLRLVSVALHDIEWVDSGDKSPGDEHDAIDLALPRGALLAATRELLRDAIAEARHVLDQTERPGVPR